MVVDDLLSNVAFQDIYGLSTTTRERFVSTAIRYLGVTSFTAHLCSSPLKIGNDGKKTHETPY